MSKTSKTNKVITAAVHKILDNAYAQIKTLLKDKKIFVFPIASTWRTPCDNDYERFGKNGGSKYIKSIKYEFVRTPFVPEEICREPDSFLFVSQAELDDFVKNEWPKLYTKYMKKKNAIMKKQKDLNLGKIIILKNRIAKLQNELKQLETAE